MRLKVFLLAVAAALFLAFPAQAQINQPAPPTVLVEPIPKSLAPAFTAGEAVIDRLGVKVGPIETLTEAPMGLIVVIKIDGKLIGVPAATLKRNGETVVSSQTKAQMLLAAGAPLTEVAGP